MKRSRKMLSKVFERDMDPIMNVDDRKCVVAGNSLATGSSNLSKIKVLDTVVISTERNDVSSPVVEKITRIDNNVSPRSKAKYLMLENVNFPGESS